MWIVYTVCTVGTVCTGCTICTVYTVLTVCNVWRHYRVLSVYPTGMSECTRTPPHRVALPVILFTSGNATARNTGSSMATGRVKSKNLFNFRLQGFLDEDITAFDEKMKTEHNIDFEAMEEMTKNQTEKEFIESMRGFMDGYMAMSAFSKGPEVSEVSLS